MNQIALHPHLLALFDLWAAPAEVAMALETPVSGAFLDQIFIAEATQSAPPVRVVKAGQALRSIYGDKINGLDLLSLFGPQDRILVWTLMRTVTLKSRPGLLRLQAFKAGEPIALDLALAPLGGGESARYLGFFQPCAALEGADPHFEVMSVHPPKGAQTAP